MRPVLTTGNDDCDAPFAVWRVNVSTPTVDGRIDGRKSITNGLCKVLQVVTLDLPIALGVIRPANNIAGAPIGAEFAKDTTTCRYSPN